MEPSYDGSRPPPPPGAVRLLSLDGGGVKGISSVMILDKIMERVRELENKPKDHEQYFPHKYFELAGGTSTGGLAALMMFRLEMNTKDTMNRYDEMSKRIFRPKLGLLDLHSLQNFGYWIGNGVLHLKKFLGSPAFDQAPLVDAIDMVVKKTNEDRGRNAPLLDNTKPKMFMCSTLVERGETILFRTYTPPSDGKPLSDRVKEVDLTDVSIGDAARATSAAPLYLPEMVIKKLRFWDGGLLNNNPIDQVWDARYDLAKSTSDTPIVSCVLSIGTSWSSKKAGPGFVNTVSSVASFATNTEAKHRDFERNIIRMNKRVGPTEETEYYRFNTPTDEIEFELDDWQQMEKLKRLTNGYLKQAKTIDRIDKCARCLLGRPANLNAPPPSPVEVTTNGVGGK